MFTHVFQWHRILTDVNRVLIDVYDKMKSIFVDGYKFFVNKLMTTC